jgi:hypothetical protein
MLQAPARFAGRAARVRPPIPLLAHPRQHAGPHRYLLRVKDSHRMAPTQRPVPITIISKISPAAFGQSSSIVLRWMGHWPSWRARMTRLLGHATACRPTRRTTSRALSSAWPVLMTRQPLCRPHLMNARPLRRRKPPPHAVNSPRMNRCERSGPGRCDPGFFCARIAHDDFSHTGTTGVDQRACGTW